MTATKAPPTVDQLLDAEGADHFLLAGVGDANLREVESLFGVRVVLRGDAVRLSGEEEFVAACTPVVEHMIGLARLGRSFGVADVARFAAAGASGGRRAATFAAPERDRALQIAVPGARRVIRARSEGQRAYLRALSESDIVVAIGPAGTGKTYLAVASAVDALLRKRVRRIILARPAVEAGENLGFLPGDLQEKVDPYLRPLYDALEDMMPPARVRRGIAERVIEIKDRKMVSHPGGFSEFWRSGRPTASRVVGRVSRRRRRSEPDRVQRAHDRQARADLERRIQESESRKLELENEMAQAFANRQMRQGRRSQRQLERLTAELQDMYDRWVESE